MTLSVLSQPAIVLLLAGVGGQDASPLTRLREVLEVASDESLSSADSVPQAALDAGPPAVAFLQTFLKRSRDEEKRGRALLALAYIGGSPAVEALRREFRRTRGSSEKSLLAFAMASTGSVEDRAFLVRSLEGEHFGDEWMPIVSAALSLGLLRAREAVPALEATSRREPESLASHAADEALRWIRQGRWSVEIPLLSEVDQAIGTVIANGIPRTDEADSFYDAERQGYWHRRKNGWAFTKGSGQEKTPSLSFKVHIGQDGRRALVSVRVYFGRLNAIGYDYVLRKQGSEWLIQGVFFTWIS